MLANMSAFGARIHRCWRSGSHEPYRAIVVVPARNEVQRITRCIEAVAAQTAAWRAALALVIFVNGTTDETYAEILRAANAAPALDIYVLQGALPAARRDAGAARQAAFRMACALPARADAVLFSTDADSIVPGDWVERYGGWIWNDGYDAIAGSVDILQDVGSDRSHMLAERIRWESACEQRLDALETWLDPHVHDPWPRHYQASGANLAIRRELAVSLATTAWPACGEDKALIAAVEAQDGRVRHDTCVRVATSGRLFGRASRGMAYTLRQRIAEPGLAWDARIEAAHHACFRARMRCQWRNIRAQASHEQAFKGFADALDVSEEVIAQAHGMPHVGASWQWLEQHSTTLHRHALKPDELPQQVAQLDELLDGLGVPEQLRPRRVEFNNHQTPLPPPEQMPALQAGA